MGLEAIVVNGFFPLLSWASELSGRVLRLNSMGVEWNLDVVASERGELLEDPLLLAEDGPANREE